MAQVDAAIKATIIVCFIMIFWIDNGCNMVENIEMHPFSPPPGHKVPRPSAQFLVYLGMRPKPRTLAVLLLGLAGILIGVTFKLNHLMGAPSLFNVGVVVTVVGVVLWVVQLVRGEAK